MASRKKVTVTPSLPETKSHRVWVYWQRRDGQPGNSPLFPHRQKDHVMGRCLKWLAITKDPEQLAYGQDPMWIIVHMPTAGRFFWEREPLRLESEEAALVLAAELERLFDWGFQSVGEMDEFVEERAKVVIRSRLNGHR